MPKPQKLYTTDPLLVLHCTDKAVQVQLGDEEPIWLPFSQIIEPDEQDLRDAVGTGDNEITIYEWLAREKGFL